MNINDILKQFVTSEFSKQRFYSEVGSIVSVDEDNMECIVSFISSNVNKDVRLGPVISDDNTAKAGSSLVIVPKVNSFVLVTFINETTGFISLFSEVDKILYQIGDRYIHIDENFIEIDGNSDNLVRFSELETAMGDLTTFINTELGKIATGITGAGGAYAPGIANIDISAAKIDEVKTS